MPCTVVAAVPDVEPEQGQCPCGEGCLDRCLDRLELVVAVARDAAAREPEMARMLLKDGIDAARLELRCRLAVPRTG